VPAEWNGRINREAGSQPLIPERSGWFAWIVQMMGRFNAEGSLRFALKAGECLRFRRNFLRQKLQRDTAMKPVVLAVYQKV
jgi:hypothetical protein